MVKKLKHFFKHIAYFSTNLIPFHLLQRYVNRDLLVVNYHSIHGVDPDPVINQNSYRTPAEFEKDIIYLKAHYNFIEFEDILNAVYGLKKLPSNSIFLTFDDGLKVVYDIFRPILLKHQISAAFFINPDFIDNQDLHFQRKKNLILEQVTTDQIKDKELDWKRVFSEAGIKILDFTSTVRGLSYCHTSILNKLVSLFEIDLAGYLAKNQIYLTTQEIHQMIHEGFIFGGHSMDHPKFEELTKEEQLKQTITSINWVKDKFNLKYTAFAFPQRDHHISKWLFQKMNEHCMVSFGVQGVGDDVISNHIQRIDIESTGQSAAQVIKLEYVKYLWRKLFNKSVFTRA